MEIGRERSRSPLYITRIASFVAVGVVAGLALAAVPNVELVTAVCFSAGYLMGPMAGLICGALTEALFAGFHPMGSTIGVTLIAQVIGMSVVGLLGGIAAFLSATRRGLLYAAVVVSSGILGTLIFDLLTNLAYIFVAGFSLSQTVVVLAAGLPFALLHIGSNALVFGFIVVPLLPRLERVLASS